VSGVLRFPEEMQNDQRLNHEEHEDIVDQSDANRFAKCCFVFFV